MSISFKNKTLLITGGLGGFGSAIIKKFISHKCNVITTTTKKYKQKKSKNLRIIYLDFNDENSLSHFDTEINKINKIDFFINNAGINIIDKIYEVKKDDLKKISNVNLIGPIWLTKLISLKMKKKKFGRIINISSIFGKVSCEKRSLYSSTKFGLIGLTKATSLDLAKYNILVNSISPGYFKTQLTKKILGKKEIKEILKKIPLNRLGKPQEVANLCLFLCSNLNSYITGENIVIDGGFTSK